MPKKAARRQDRDEHAVEWQIDVEPRAGFAAQHFDAGEQRAMAEQLAQRLRAP